MYYGKGPHTAIMNSTHRRRFNEEAIRPDDDLYVLGPAMLREDVVAPMIAHKEDERYYFISTKSESQIVRSKGILSGVLLFFAAVTALAVPAFGIAATTDLEPLEAFVQKPLSELFAAFVFLLVFSFLYLTLLYNGLVRVRNRLQLALSLIEVQLKRRHDLVPQLLECVRAITSHEKELHLMVTEARSQAAQWGSASSDVNEEMQKAQGLVGQLFALAEDYPDLKVDGNYRLFMEQLTDTEDRIALARAFYNDSLRALRDRLLTFPDVLVAKWFRFQSGKQLQFIQEPSEREVPAVSLDTE